MEQSVTYDELVAFAAKKVGGEPYLLNMSDVMVRIDGKALPLSSWDLMGKGLAVCPHIILIQTRGGFMPPDHGRVCLTDKDNPLAFSSHKMQEVADMPLAFWTAWYALEPDQQTQEPT